MASDYDKLFQLKDPLANQPIRLKPYHDDWLDRGTAIRVLRGQILPKEPIKLRPARGGRFTDLLWSTFSPIHVISQRLVDLLSGHGFTGWSLYGVDVQDKDGESIPNYFGLAITGRAGSHDLSRVEAIDKPPITPKGSSYVVLRGIYFTGDYWDGNDFCLMDQNISCIVTERVMRAFRRGKIRNMRFTPLSQVEITSSVYEARGLWPIKDGL